MLLFCFIFGACTNSARPKDAISKINDACPSLRVPTATKDVNNTETDTVEVYGPNAIFLLMTPGESANQKDVDSEEADDTAYYSSEAQKFLEKQGIKTIGSQGSIFVFTKADGEKKIIRRSEGAARASSMILFDGKKDPKIIFPIDIESEYNAYFLNNGK